MTKNTSITGLQYNLEWIDHLHSIYADFSRRNDEKEWLYFLNRPELADPKTYHKVATEVLKYITKYEHISQKVVQFLDETFKFSNEREKFESSVGFENMECYLLNQLNVKEFPPYDLFGELDSEKDYDNYLALFHEIYYNLSDASADEYKECLDGLSQFEIKHPYENLLQSELCLRVGGLTEAADWLRTMENGYYKQIALGDILTVMEAYDEAEICYSEAFKLSEGRLEGQLISNILFVKWKNNKIDETLELIETFNKMEYEYVVTPIKKIVYEEIAKALLEKARNTILSEEEFALIKDYYMLNEEFDNVIKLCEMSWKKGYEFDSWTVDAAESYLETAQFEKANNIINMVYEGQKTLSRINQLKIRELKARLLFITGKISEAYDIMRSVCSHPDCKSKQKYVLAKMYMTTENFTAAIELLRELRVHQPYNLEYSYDLGKCYAKEGEYTKARYFFSEICTTSPDYKDVAYQTIQAIMDHTDDESVIQATRNNVKTLNEFLTDIQKDYIKGQIFEMEGEFKEAKMVYKSITEKYPDDKSLLFDVYIRYFLMMFETGARIFALEKEILQAIQRYPRADAILTHLADLYDDVDYKTDERAAYYTKALEANKFNGYARMQLVSVYTDSEEYEKARALCDEMVVYTESLDAYMLRARFNMDLGNYNEVYEDINTYEAKGGSKNEYRDLKASVCMYKGEYEEALKLYEEIKKYKKISEQPPYDDMAICMCKLGRADEAADMLKLVSDNSTNPQFFKILYIIQLHIGDFKGAAATIKKFRKSCKLGFFNEGVKYLEAMIMLDEGKLTRAKALFDTMIEDEGERTCGIVEALFMNRRAAVKLLKNRIKEEPNEIDNYSWLAFTHYLKGERDKAAEVANAGIRVFTELFGNIESYMSCERLCQYGFLKMMSGDENVARKSFERALGQMTCPHFVCKECFEAHMGMGILHALSGRKSEAVQEFDISLSERPNNTICKKIKEILT